MACHSEAAIAPVPDLAAMGTSKRPRILLPAHLDEVGLMVKYVDDKGFIRFWPLGGWFSQVLLAQATQPGGSPQLPSNLQEIFRPFDLNRPDPGTPPSTQASTGQASTGPASTGQGPESISLSWQARAAAT